MNRTGRVFAAVAGLALAACCAHEAAADARLDAARARWHAAGQSAYEYGYRKFCECHPETPPETIVSVRDERVVRVRHRPVDSDIEVPAQDKNLQFYWTMEGLFTLIESALTRGAAVRVEYDDALGFPRSVDIDYDPDFIGDELDLKLTGVVPLPR
jgi:Family of unknown function (DUF6174)